MTETEISPDDIGPQHIGALVRTDHGGVIHAGVIEFYRRNFTGLHLLYRGGESQTFSPPPPKSAFRSQKEADNPRIFLCS